MIPKCKTKVLRGAVLILLSALIGCGTSPTAPNPASGDNAIGPVATSPPILRVNSDGSAEFVQLSGAPRSSSSSGPQTASAKIDGNKGGKVGCGRFTVIVPAGAYIGPATITISIADPNLLICDLSITPSAANNFKVPVQLIQDVKDIPVDPNSLTTYWYDPNRKQWVNLYASTDAAACTVTAYLTHFSTYATGKAGW